MRLLCLFVVCLAGRGFAYRSGSNGAQKSMNESFPRSAQHSKSNLSKHESKSNLPKHESKSNLPKHESKSNLPTHEPKSEVPKHHSNSKLSEANALKTAYSDLYLDHEMAFLGFCAYNGPRYNLGFKSAYIQDIRIVHSLMKSDGDMCLAHWKASNTLYHGTPKGNWPGETINSWGFYSNEEFYATNHVSTVPYFAYGGDDSFKNNYLNASFTSQFLDHPKVRKYKIAGSTAGTPDMLYFDLEGSKRFNHNFQGPGVYSLFNGNSNLHCPAMNASFRHFMDNYPNWKGNQVFLAGWTKYFEDHFNFTVRGVLQTRFYASAYLNNDAAAYCWRHHGKDNGFTKDSTFEERLVEEDGCLKSYLESNQDVLSKEDVEAIKAIINHKSPGFPDKKVSYNVMYEEICLKDTPETFIGDDNITDTETSLIKNLAGWGKDITANANHWDDPPYSLDYMTWVPGGQEKAIQKLRFWKAVETAQEFNWGTIRTQVRNLIDGMSGKLQAIANREDVIRTKILPAFKALAVKSSTHFLTANELDNLRVYAHLLLNEFCKDRRPSICARKWVDRQDDTIYHDRDIINDDVHLIEGVEGTKGVQITKCYKDGVFNPTCKPTAVCEKRSQNVNFFTANSRYCKPRAHRQA